MKRIKLQWKKAAAISLTSVVVLQSGFLTDVCHAVAQEETETAKLQELIAPELQTEEGAASCARLRIGDWLDYGDYGIERTDIPGTDYFFYITTQDEDGTVINDDQLSYCVQSYFLTPLPGDHSDDMTDQVSAVGDGKSLQKIIYYGYGGAGYDADEFVAFLAQSDADYFENVYMNLSESEQAEVCYILTHAAASYAYFTDGTSLEEYLKIQFQIKYGENWERELDRFKAKELEMAGITDGDMDLFGATYGMNTVGIALAKGWYQLLSVKAEPGLNVTADDGVYTFNGNENNQDLELSFSVPEGFICAVSRMDGKKENFQEGSKVTVCPAESFAFTYVDEEVSFEKDGISELTVPVEGILSGTENEVWNLVLLQTYKGTGETVSRRQQDIAAASMADAGRTEMDFEITLQKGSVLICLADDGGQAVEGAEFGIFYDDAYSIPLQQDGENVRMTTDSQGEAYLEFVMNQELLENDGKLYVKELEAPVGYLMDEEVQCIDVNGKVNITNAQETTSVNGAVGWNVPEGTALPEKISVILKQDNEIADTKTVTEEDDWSYEWENLPKYRRTGSGAAVEYDYSVEIAPMDGYDTAVDGYDAVNTITGEISVEGQGIWHDSDDADGLRPKSITVDLCRDGALIDSLQISEADDWRYSFDGLDQYSEDGSQEYAYTVEAEAPEGYSLAIDGDQITVVHTASTSLDIEGMVDLTGRNVREGEFSFELTQVTDETGETEVEGGIHGEASNDSEGRITFPNIICMEPGTYYFRITENPARTDAGTSQIPTEEEAALLQTDFGTSQMPTEEEEVPLQADAGTSQIPTEEEAAPLQTDTGELQASRDSGEDLKAASYIVKAEVTVSGENKDQLEAVITYPDGEPEFEYAYTASGEAVIDSIRVVLENGALEDGAFHVELKDKDGNVLQTAVNGADGKAAFEPLEYTEEDIGEEYVYTVSELSDGADDITYDSSVYTVTVKVEDSENSDGTLDIKLEAEEMVFTNVFAEPETEQAEEAETEGNADSDTETEEENKTETGEENKTETGEENKTETGAENETETGAENETKTGVENETESGMEKGIVTGQETETETVTAAETADETESESEAMKSTSETDAGNNADGAETETQAETRSAQTGRSAVIWIIVLLAVVILILFFRSVKRRK